MNIGILSFYREINFGATLQGLSTFYYLKKAGYNPIFINYYSKKKDRIYTPLFDKNEQTSCFRTFVDEVITTQTPLCHNAEEINEQIEKYKIDAIIVGSDAVMQHHPFINRIKYGGKRILRIIPQLPDTTFPNPFWGVGINDSVKIEIIDTGDGINEEEIPYIWDRYYKAKGNHKRAKIGTGLGLAIVKNILQLHNLRNYAAYHKQ